MNARQKDDVIYDIRQTCASKFLGSPARHKSVATSAATEVSDRRQKRRRDRHEGRPGPHNGRRNLGEHRQGMATEVSDRRHERRRDRYEGRPCRHDGRRNPCEQRRNPCEHRRCLEDHITMPAEIERLNTGFCIPNKETYGEKLKRMSTRLVNKRCPDEGTAQSSRTQMQKEPATRRAKEWVRGLAIKAWRVPRSQGKNYQRLREQRDSRKRARDKLRVFRKLAKPAAAGCKDDDDEAELLALTTSSLTIA